jgi:hypothetical protein
MVLIGTARAGLVGPVPWALATPALTSTGAGALAEVPGLMGGLNLLITLADLRPC